MISAKEALERQRQQHEAQIRDAERMLDSAIEKSQDPRRAQYTFSYAMHGVVENALRELYGAGGWHVTVQRHSDQREGDATCVILTAMNAPSDGPGGSRG